MAINDGGPAFPTTAYYDERPYGVLDGMKLRDYFAAKAMAALVQYQDRFLDEQDALPVDAIARDAYALADAMIAARGKQ